MEFRLEYTIYFLNFIPAKWYYRYYVILNYNLNVVFTRCVRQLQHVYINNNVLHNSI